MDGHAASVSVAADVDTLVKTRGTPPQPAEQLMFSCYVSRSWYNNRTS